MVEPRSACVAYRHRDDTFQGDVMAATIGDVEREAAIITIQIASENMVAAIRAGLLPGRTQNYAINLTLTAAGVAIQDIRDNRPETTM